MQFVVDHLAQAMHDEEVDLLHAHGAGMLDVEVEVVVAKHAPHLAAVASELRDTEAMVAAAEHLYGPYRWGRYDMIVLPPSFPYGDMENPTLTFLTQTVIASDRSMVSVIEHKN